MSKKVEEELAKRIANERAVKQLLLLGTGESGKSTIFKQIISLYGTGFTENEKKEFLPVIHENIIVAAKVSFIVIITHINT